MLQSNARTVLDFMCSTMIDPASSWFKMVELIIIEVRSKTGKKVELEELLNKTSKQIARFSRYHRPRVVIYNNGSEFKCHFQDLCRTLV